MLHTWTDGEVNVGGQMNCNVKTNEYFTKYDNEWREIF